MKKLDLTKNDITPLALFFFSFSLLIIGIILKSLVVIAGFAGLVIAWFLCIDTILANQRMNPIKRIVFGGIVIFLPVLFALYMR